MVSTVRNKTTRAEFILQEVLRNGRVGIDALSRQLQVNPSTIRRDLEALERQNLVRRVHGGAMPVDTLDYTAYSNGLTFQADLGKQVEEKASIGLAAARLIRPGDTIAISPGTTTTYLARSIRSLQIPSLNVITNALNVAMELTGLPGITVTVTGGIVLPDSFAMVGPLAEASLDEMYADKAFVGVTGLSVEHGLTSPNQLEALTYRATLQRASETIVLADHTKLNRVALYRIAPISAMHKLVTDRAASPLLLDSFRAAGIDVLET